MSFSRAFLKSVGLTDEQISAVMEEHTAVTTALKTQRDQFEGEASQHKADAEKLSQVQKELDELKARKDYKADFDKAVKDLEDYKAKVAAEAEAAKVRAAYKQLLSDEKINDKQHEAILKVTDFSGMKLDKDGRLENADKLKEAISKDWAPFKVTIRDRGEDVPHPPRTDNGGGVNTEMQMYAKRFHDERYGKKESD